jgi:hypothetical protein
LIRRPQLGARQGPDAARDRRSAGGVAPPVTGLLEQVQVDHTPVDVIVVDERHRLPIGRPYLTVAIDVLSHAEPAAVVCGLVEPAGLVPRRWSSARTQLRSVSRLTPRSSAIEAIVAPGLDRNRATASALNCCG